MFRFLNRFLPARVGAQAGGRRRLVSREVETMRLANQQADEETIYRVVAHGVELREVR